MRCLNVIAPGLAMLSHAVPEAAAATPDTPVKIVLVGDSTIAQQTGWGGAFCDLHVTQYVACVPMGRGGRSTKTYRSEGAWTLALDEASTAGYPARYVLIDMGHNDKSMNPTVGTGLYTDFPANLTRMVRDVRDRGAIPVLVTPLSTRHFSGGKLADSMIPWAEVVRNVASQTNTLVLDLNKASEQLFARLGPVRSMDFEGRPLTQQEIAAAKAGTTLAARQGGSKLGNQADYLHLNARGADDIASLVAKLLAARIPALAAHVFP